MPWDHSPILANGQPSAPVPSPEAAPDGPGRPPERVLCFPSAMMDDPSRFAPGRFCGFRTDAPEMSTRLFPKGVTELDFVYRFPSLELNTSIKQVIACVVPWHASTRQVWVFRRGASEGRLEGKLSCLVSGHVNIADAHPDGMSCEDPVDLLDATFRGSLREMGEEVGDWNENWKSHHSDCRLILAGCVNDEDAVGRVHFGVVYRLDVARLEIPAAFARDAGQGQGWMPVDRLISASFFPHVESWSHHVGRHLAESSPVRSAT